MRGDLLHHTRQVGGGDVKLVGIEAYVVVLLEIVGQQTDEVLVELASLFGQWLVAFAELIQVHQLQD